MNSLRGYAVPVGLVKTRLFKVFSFTLLQAHAQPMFLFLSFWVFVWFICYLFHLKQARYFFQQLISGVSYCHSMVHYYKPGSELFERIKENYFKYYFLLCRKSVTVIWNSRIHSWTEVQHRVLKYVTLGTQRYNYILVYEFGVNYSAYIYRYVCPCWLAVCFVAFTTQVNSGYSSLHRTGSTIKKRIRWQGNSPKFCCILSFGT